MVAPLEMAVESVSQSPVKLREGYDTECEAAAAVLMDIQPCEVGNGQVNKDAAGDGDTASKQPSNPSVTNGANDLSEGKCRIPWTELGYDDMLNISKAFNVDHALVGY